MGFSREVLQLDVDAEIARICAFLREQVLGRFKKRGAVLGLSGGVDSAVVTALAAQGPDEATVTARLPLDAYLKLVAATNHKQRARKTTEYFHAERLNYAVLGTANRLEHDQGFFVKQGDGAADVKPIAHLYKTQVYQLAAHLGIPEEIRRRPPTTDTFSMPQTQEEFYFALPYQRMDLCLYALNHGIAAEIG